MYPELSEALESVGESVRGSGRSHHHASHSVRIETHTQFIHLFENSVLFFLNIVKLRSPCMSSCSLQSFPH